MHCLFFKQEFAVMYTWFPIKVRSAVYSSVIRGHIELSLNNVEWSRDKTGDSRFDTRKTGACLHKRHLKITQSIHSTVMRNVRARYVIEEKRVTSDMSHLTTSRRCSDYTNKFTLRTQRAELFAYADLGSLTRRLTPSDPWYYLLTYFLQQGHN